MPRRSPRRSTRCKQPSRKVELPPLSIDLGPPPERHQHDDIGETVTEKAGTRRRYVIDQVARLHARREITDEQAVAACRWRQDREILDRYSVPSSHGVWTSGNGGAGMLPDRVLNAIGRYRRAEHAVGCTLMNTVGPLILDARRLHELVAARSGGRRKAVAAIKSELQEGLKRIAAVYRAHDDSVDRA